MGYLEIDQIAQFIFQTNYKNASRRLVKLAKDGYVKTYRKLEDDGKKVVVPDLECIGGLVNDEAFSKGRMAFSQRRKLWQRNNMDHDVQVRHWCLRILKLTPSLSVELDFALLDSEWGYGVTEADRKKIPDFVLVDETESKVAFEIERHPKARSEYIPIFTKALSRYRRPVIYLCETGSTVNKASKVLSEVQDNFRRQDREPSSQVIIKHMDEVQSDRALLDLLTAVFGMQSAELVSEFNTKQIGTSRENAEIKFSNKNKELHEEHS
jgi:hypothetical protein